MVKLNQKITQRNSNIRVYIYPKYDFHSYSLRLLNEKGELILDENFESYDYVFIVSDTIKKENSELFVVVQSPFEQLTLRKKKKK